MASESDYEALHLIVQICALNEQESIGHVIRNVPREFACGGHKLQTTIVVVDDGSTDSTVSEARLAGADHIVRHTSRRGLARAFQLGIDTCLELGADIIVNLDADGQYEAKDIPLLIAPIVDGHADVVVGDRQVDSLDHFSWQKKLLQNFGSWVVRQAAGVEVQDAVSGFRAYGVEAAQRICVTAQFSYTIETLIQAGKSKLAVRSVPIRANHTSRPSRLHKGSIDFVTRQALILLRAYATFEPSKTFVVVAAPFLATAGVLLGRLALISANSGGLVGHVQSLTVGIIALVIGIVLVSNGVIADRMLEQRRMLETILYRQRKGQSRK